MLYSDFHKKSVHDTFYSDQLFTMLDILNFAEQIVIALINDYLDKGFMHRDIKSGNILLHHGVIQIIDNGSIYLFDSHFKNHHI